MASRAGPTNPLPDLLGSRHAKMYENHGDGGKPRIHPDYDEDELVSGMLDDLLNDVVAEVVSDATGSPEVCVVCYEDTRPSQMETTVCNHRFCKPCLDKIKKTRPMCPLCRFRLGEDPPAPAYEESIFHLLIRLISLSSRLNRQDTLERDTRHMLLDIVFGVRNSNLSNDIFNDEDAITDEQEPIETQTEPEEARQPSILSDDDDDSSSSTLDW
ncbi:hypothetical protein DIPPA_19894 [Diplonema papillatum]|nr:hypothetical protein DIPPA_19894 [Diplonema papillatum]